MSKKLKTTRVLVIDTALVILFSFALVLANIYLTNQVGDRLKVIDDTRERKLTLILKMTHIARERTSLMLKMYIEEDVWQVDEDFLKFYKIALDFIGLRDELVNLGLTDSEESLFNDSLSLIKITEPLQEDIVERIKSGDLKGVHEDIARKDIPLEIELLGIFERLTRQVISNAYSAQLKVKSQYTRTLLGVSVVSIIVLLTIIYLMNRSLRKIRDIELDLILEAENQGWDASHDPLTNIYNRRWLKHKLENLLQTEGHGSVHHVLIYMDLDDFKVINDNFGHVAGDSYLQTLCRTVEGCIRQSDSFVRMGGDEFAILLEYCNLDTASKIAHEVLSSIRKLEVIHAGQTLSTHCSMGVYEFAADDLTFDEIIHRVDALCYEAKKNGKDRIVLDSIAS